MKSLTLFDPEMTNGMIIESPGFAKKGLSDYHMDLARRCGASCSYCSTNAGYPARVNRARLTALAREQLGVDVDPTREPGISIAWDRAEVLRRLEAQLAGKSKAWGHGKTLMVSQLTDAFIGYPLTSGLTRAALDMVLERTSFRIRILTKCDVVARPGWVDYFKAHEDRFVVGLSVGTLDDEWARRVEIGTTKPTARLRALHTLQDAGVTTFGMMCPVFPDMLRSDGGRDIDALIDAIRPDLCETVWAEPFNDRDNWEAVRNGYDPGSVGWTWFQDVYGSPNRARGRMLWSRYATALYERLKRRAMDGAWMFKLDYLLYEDQITSADAATFTALVGVLLQSKPAKDGYSPNDAVRALQSSPTHGRVA